MAEETRARSRASAPEHPATRAAGDSRQPAVRHRRSRADESGRATRRGSARRGRRRATRVLRAAGRDDGDRRRHHGARRARVGTQRRSRSRPHHDRVAGARRCVRSGADDSRCVLFEPRRVDLRTGCTHGRTRGSEHPLAVDLQRRVRGELHHGWRAARGGRCVDAAVRRRVRERRQRSAAVRLRVRTVGAAGDGRCRRRARGRSVVHARRRSFWSACGGTSG